jgi:outer membrane receptor protein involved in Fe transport
MKSLYRIISLMLLTVMVVVCPLWSGTTGKIAGIVLEKDTGEPLPGANVTILETALGAASDIHGHYTILHVPPGIYNLQVSVIGYARVTVSDVRVLIDQTARVDFDLEIEAIEGEAVTIVAEKSIIKPDVATSVVAVSDKEVEALPVVNVENVVGMQAGIRGSLSSQLNGAAQPSYISNSYNRGKVSVQGGLSIRGGQGDNILFQLDGVTLRDPRNNEPISKVALSAIKEISVERGGFNAEYGQVRSGIINVVTREGSKRGYYGSIQTRVSPPAPKYWNGDGVLDIHDPNSYIMRPFLDDAVCWTGTGNGAWDEYTRRQYPEFMGWNAVSEILLKDNDPNNDLTPLGAQRAFMYETRKKQPNDMADYDIDAGFGGPVPMIGKDLGNLRFFSSYRRTRDVLLFPLTRPDYRDYDWTSQLTADITPSMKLRLSSLAGKQYTIRHNWDATGIYFYPHTPNEIANVASAINATSDLITLFSDFNFALADIGHRSVAAKLTHTLSSKTLYEVSLEHFMRDYNVRPSALRDTSKHYEIIPGFYEDSNPFGYWPYDAIGVAITGGQHVAKARDFTKVSSTTLKADLTSQLNFNNLVKAGVEFLYNDLNFDYGTIQSATAGKTYASRVQMHVFPVQAALYLQDKLETNGFTMNAGLRLDYSSSRANWWDVSPYDPTFFSTRYNSTRVFPEVESKSQWQLSPRLGIAHPITENSKLFFNYGHFKQVPQYESLFRVERSETRSLSNIGDPNLILAKTISYELGYDQLLFENYLLQLAAFYNDISDQQDFTRYSSITGFAYTKATSNSYEDVRGFELTLRKSSGNWWTGFANYTYQVNTTGHFGSARLFEDPSQQKKFNEATVNLYQDRPIPRPYARVDLSLYTPNNFGPSFLGHPILGGWMANVLLDWQAGYWTTWNPKNLPYIAYNVKSVNYFNTILRLTKNIDINKLRLQFFVDVNNVLNTLRLWNTGDQDYMESLHLPKSKVYDNIPGEDKVGDYRKPGVEFQPMEYQAVIDQTKAGKVRPIYYEGSTGKYWQYTAGTDDQPGQWSQVDQKRIDQVLADKAYIDMPNATTFNFLDPRKIFFGIRLSFDLTE